MLYEVCYRALLSISVVEATNGRVAREACLHTHAPARAAARAGSRAAHRARSSIFRFQPQDSLAGGPPARWFVIPWIKHHHDGAPSELTDGDRRRSP